MYTVIHSFRDMQDNNTAYLVGSTYPRKGLEPTEGRIEELSTNKNRLKIPLIEKVEDKPKKTRKKKED